MPSDAEYREQALFDARQAIKAENKRLNEAVLDWQRRLAATIDERDQLRAENQAMREVVDDVRGFIKGNALWVDVLGSLRALDGQAQPRDEGTSSS